jgi:hypothetical protein
VKLTTERSSDEVFENCRNFMKGKSERKRPPKQPACGWEVGVWMAENCELKKIGAVPGDIIFT